MEIKSIEKLVLLGNLQKQGSIPIQTVVLQLINEVQESYRRRQAVYGRWICYFYPGDSITHRNLFLDQNVLSFGFFFFLYFFFWILWSTNVN